ncbi:rhodanese-like domain-containing protein [Flavobacterium phycosphaerae]|uniref:rhodanese-like domain-containing protein n=1 Tax=Flavobacterium phycosphaerae TaxID=2697515 RepID=UPI0013895DDB|nr:rhodanese-like domain-containing protein [Flavobacterium phycosphaerae]
MGLFSFLGLGNKGKDIKEFVSRNAVIIDVRTIGEFQSGHIKDSKNIPLDTVSRKITEIKNWNKPVIVCCRSGMRSAQAASLLKSNGIEVLNGGGWQSLESKL